MLQQIGILTIPQDEQRSNLLLIVDWKVLALKIPVMDGTSLTVYSADDQFTVEADQKAVKDGSGVANDITFTPDTYASWSENDNKLNLICICLASDSAETAERKIIVYGIPRR